MTTPNAELAYQVLDHIDDHPEQWRQDLYIGKSECGTVACFAGWTVLLSGDAPVYDGDRDYVIRGLPTTAAVRVGHGETTTVSHRAQVLLRAGRWVREGYEDEADLFDQYNTREDLGRLVAEIFGPRPGGEPR